MEGSMKELGVAGIVILAVTAWASVTAAEEKFQKLAGAQIRARIAGMEISDEVHWREMYDRSGKVTSMSMGRKRTGKWRVEKDQLCIELEKDPVNCYEVWVSGKKVKLQREGLLPLEGVIESPTGRL
jgi:hypothetical protein